MAAEFVIPLLIAFAGGALLALLLLRVALEVGSALLYVLGGLLLGLSPTEFGRRLLTGWLIAATAMLLLPLLWTIVFVCGAAIMLDAGTATGKGGLARIRRTALQRRRRDGDVRHRHQARPRRHAPSPQRHRRARRRRPPPRRRPRARRRRSDAGR